MTQRIIQTLENWLQQAGLDHDTSKIVLAFIILISIAIISVLLNYVAKKIILNIVKQIVKHTKNTWDDILLEKKVFHRFSHIAPAIIIYYAADIFLGFSKGWLHFAHAGVYIYMTIVFMLIFSSFLSALNAIYLQSYASTNKPIKGYLQVINIFNYAIGSIIILSILLDKDPSYFITGMGALAAVLLLVFKDSLLGLVAGIQLSANDMVKIGDWISMPSKNADGMVTEISLNTVKVQNWDKTITLVPSYALVSESFINWRSMEESGSRRVKRALLIDLKTIHFLSQEEIDGLKKVHHLKDYLEQKEQEIENFNNENNVDTTTSINGRRMTNIGTFRKYCEMYLNNHPKVRQDMTLIVRQLQPEEKGLPLELYFFLNLTEWVPYEAIQSDIFDHLLAIVPEFGLKVFQNPTDFGFGKSNPSK
ncbi:MAG: mechanosensitive ion channel protein MscS [Bacteroidetes bacterium HGW-Bacteroidetes-21]|jgi:miniconductance mechanosensitive channel|nr:MAG: mechanosensitive ion channel protein MscS [Bacteroidetes bacterium HGW-Bacteroidetes-21]